MTKNVDEVSGASSWARRLAGYKSQIRTANCDSMSDSMIPRMIRNPHQFWSIFLHALSSLFPMVEIWHVFMLIMLIMGISSCCNSNLQAFCYEQLKLGHHVIFPATTVTFLPFFIAMFQWDFSSGTCGHYWSYLAMIVMGVPHSWMLFGRVYIPFKKDDSHGGSPMTQETTRCK